MMTAGLPLPYLEQHGRGFIERYTSQPGNRSYAIADTEDRLIGVIGFYFHDDKPTELGYWLGEPYWGQGYVPEAVAALLDAARATGLFPVVKARVLAENPASVRVLEKSGFTVVEHTTSVVERHRGKPLLILSWSASS
jgi:RimJ/RimL family protein N-acetyltransferase